MKEDMFYIYKAEIFCAECMEKVIEEEVLVRPFLQYQEIRENGKVEGVRYLSVSGQWTFERKVAQVFFVPMKLHHGADGTLPAVESEYDSDDYPKGPYPLEEEETDEPWHCAKCGKYLETDLSSQGEYELVATFVELCHRTPFLIPPDYEAYRKKIRALRLQDEVAAMDPNIWI